MSTTQQRAAKLLSVIPLMVLLAAFTGAMQLATDATAGERERGSLEALLVNPVPRGALALGKVMASALAGMLAVMVTAGLCTALLRFIPLQELGMRFRFGTPHMLGLMAAALPMCLLTASVQSCVATLAKSFKEAQTYMGILILAPDDHRRDGHALSDRQPAVDVRRAAARPVRAADQRARRLRPGPARLPRGRGGVRAGGRRCCCARRLRC